MDSAREELIERTASLVAEERGAGGKFRKALLRKPPAKPYDRPPPRQQQRGRWLSKLVDPAFRLISGGANLVFPSFFSKSSTVDALPVAIPDNDRDNLKAEAKQNVDCGDGISTVDVRASTFLILQNINNSKISVGKIFLYLWIFMPINSHLFVILMPNVFLNSLLLFLL
uniref:Uncharacterized protein MANES_14G133500 n=1 Tax=Rhizophora mucronata TaxID=61149 RepID=A0A2P2INJ6_RHIMU